MDLLQVANYLRRSNPFLNSLHPSTRIAEIKKKAQSKTGSRSDDARPRVLKNFLFIPGRHYKYSEKLAVNSVGNSLHKKRPCKYCHNESQNKNHHMTKTLQRNYQQTRQNHMTKPTVVLKRTNRGTELSQIKPDGWTCLLSYIIGLLYYAYNI